MQWSGWIPCRRGAPDVPSNAETVQNLIGMLNGLTSAKQRAWTDYQKKAAQVKVLADGGHQRQAWETMQTAKLHRKRWERCHTMMESVEQIKSRIMEQQQNAALFSSFSAASDQLAHMLEAVPLDSIDTLMGNLEERMAQATEVGESLASGPGTMAVDEDELEAFLRQDQTEAPLLVLPDVPTGPPVVRRAQPVAMTE